MNFKKYRPIFETAIFALLAFLLHTLFFTFFSKNGYGFKHYSLLQLYSFFLVCSLVIIVVLIRIKQKNIDNVGHTFMLLTCIKIVLAYLLLHPILNSHFDNSASEKINFFITFAVFLTIETVVTIRLLNKTEN